MDVLLQTFEIRPMCKWKNQRALYHRPACSCTSSLWSSADFLAPLKGQTVYSSKTKPVHPSESLPLQRATVHFPSLCFKGLAPWELLLFKHDCKQALQFSARRPSPFYRWGVSHCEGIKSQKQTKEHHITAVAHTAIVEHQEMRRWPENISAECTEHSEEPVEMDYKPFSSRIKIAFLVYAVWYF